jgi:hypothetical protein
MDKCDECGKERSEKDLRYNPKWKNMIYRYCFIDELIGNAEKNKATGALLSNPQAYFAARQAASLTFDKFLKKEKK